ncbi:hypothetical protein DYH09_19920 [bacterium CPR1]|nr:hypothetical protein [bacterium CPR1]
MMSVPRRTRRDLFWALLVLSLLALGLQSLPRQPAPPPASDWWSATGEANHALEQGQHLRAEALFEQSLELADQPALEHSSLQSLACVKELLGKKTEARQLKERAGRLYYNEPGLARPAR